MPVAQVKFYVLDVGQGSCNYVEIIDDKGVVTNNMLIDIGTDSSHAIAEDNMEWLRDKIKDRTDPRIDVVVLTHGDTDHYNLLLGLLPALKPAKKTRIGMIRYGGEDDDYTVGDPLTILASYCADIKGFTSNTTGYDPDDVDPWSGPIWPKPATASAVQLRLLVANLPVLTSRGKPVKKPRDDARKNTGSVVVGVYWDNHWYICTGDGTGSTLAGANDVFDGHAADMPFTFLMTTPHHGSVKTTYNLSSSSGTPSDMALQVVDTFVGTFNPFTVSASAGEKNHHHASMFVVEQFSRYTKNDEVYWSDPECGKGKERHFITTWVEYQLTGTGVTPVFPQYVQYVTTQTKKNVYTTHYFTNDPYNNSVSKSVDVTGPGGKKKKAKVDTYPYQYISPPEPAVGLAGVEATGVPLGRNYEFYMTAASLGMRSTANDARTEAAAVAMSWSAAPPSFVTASGRIVRAALAPPPPPPRLVPRALPLLEPGFHPLRSLRAIA